MAWPSLPWTLVPPAAVPVKPSAKVATASVLTRPLSVVGSARGKPAVLAPRPIRTRAASSSAPSSASLAQPLGKLANLFLDIDALL